MKHFFILRFHEAVEIYNEKGKNSLHLYHREIIQIFSALQFFINPKSIDTGWIRWAKNKLLLQS